MVYQKIIKNTSTLTGLVIALLIAIGFFTGMYIYLEWNVNDVGSTLDTKYSASYSNLTETQSDLSENIQDIKDNLADIAEADSTWQVAWNGMKGLGNTLKLPISFVTTAIATYTGIESSLDFIPLWVKALVSAGIIGFLVFLVLSILKGDQRL